MSKKVIILNGSPRKNFNTAKMLKEAQKGAESVGAEVEYINLVDLNYNGASPKKSPTRRTAGRSWWASCSAAASSSAPTT